MKRTGHYKGIYNLDTTKYPYWRLCVDLAHEHGLAIWEVIYALLEHWRAGKVQIKGKK